MKILFVTDAGRFRLAEPLGMMCLSSVLRDAGHETRFAPDTLGTARRIVRQWKPDVVGYTATTGEHLRLIRLNRSLKQFGRFYSVFGGPHATFFPTLIDEDGVDAICRGEGEGAMLDLVKALAEGKPTEKIANLWVKTEDGVVHKNDVRPLIPDLDKLPFADYESFYRLYNRAQVIGNIHFMASRGCPFNCPYCFNRAYCQLYSGKGKRCRLRSPEYLVCGVEQIAVTYKPSMVVFMDDVFPTNKTWLAEFGALYRKRIGLPFVCNERFDVIDRDVCQLLKDAGCHAMMLGIESGNETLRREVLNRNMTDNQIRQGCQILHGLDIKIQTFNIIGIPRETVETAMETLRLNIDCRVDLALASFCQPYPGTELRETACKMGLIDESAEPAAGVTIAPRVWKIKDKAKLRRLRSLFTAVVAMPSLMPFVPLLMRLPLALLYTATSRLWAGYLYKFRLFRPVKLKPLSYMKAVLAFLSGIHQH